MASLMASRASQRGHGNQGGYRAPVSPAPVSGPGALSQRTDGGPAQPIRPTPANRPGGQIGDRKASIQQQQAAPLRQGGVVVPAGPPPAHAIGPMDPASADAIQHPVDVWGPTQRPGEPVTAGAHLGAGPGADPADNGAHALLASLYERFGDDNLRALLEQLGPA